MIWVFTLEINNLTGTSTYYLPNRVKLVIMIMKVNN